MATDVQPLALVTVKLYVPGFNPLMVVVEPEPETLPGLIVQVPDGKPLSATLPVAVAHVGCVIVPTVGVAGVAGAALITTFADAAEVQPSVLVTVNVWVPAARPATVVVVPVPVVVAPPGLRVRVQVPVEGNPLNATLPVAKAQVGCVIVPKTGAVGVPGCKTVKAEVATHPFASVTVTVYVPPPNPLILCVVAPPGDHK